MWKHELITVHFVSETLIFDAPVILFNKITTLMIHMLHNEPLKMHTLCNNKC